MNEVKLNRYAGPFREADIPYNNYIQSLVGLVPKAGGKTRLIFHLSYQFELGSVNGNTPSEWCSVKYNNLDHAVKNSLKLVGTDNKNIILLKNRSVICF